MSRAAPADVSETRVTLDLRTRVLPFKASDRWEEVAVQRSFAPEESAILICDVWDTHWCRTTAERAAEIAGRIDALIKVVRLAGVQVVHSPSSTMGFYEGEAQRQRMASTPRIDPPEPLDLPDPALPIDDSDGGCDTGDCTPTRPRPWTRQHRTIQIAAGDVISDDGREIYSLLRDRGIETLFFTGVATNMCVLNRSFGIKQMTRWGVDCVLVRDLTDSMYNPKRAPYVSHDEGTELVVEHIERHWCPTTTSSELVALLRG